MCVCKLYLFLGRHTYICAHSGAVLKRKEPPYDPEMGLLGLKLALEDGKWGSLATQR